MSQRSYRIPTAMAGLAIIAGTVVACGDDDGSEPIASDPTSSSPSSSASETPSGSTTPTPSETANSDPVPSPIINKAVKAALEDQFPALIPAGVPAGWTVLSATYEPKGGGAWTISLTDPNGAPVTLMQSTAKAADLIAELLPDGKPGGTVKISGTGKWSVYTGTASAGLAKDFSGTGAVVVGADLDAVSELANELLTAEDAGSGDGG